MCVLLNVEISHNTAAARARRVLNMYLLTFTHIYYASKRIHIYVCIYTYILFITLDSIHITL